MPSAGTPHSNAECQHSAFHGRVLALRIPIPSASTPHSNDECQHSAFQCRVPALRIPMPSAGTRHSALAQRCRGGHLCDFVPKGARGGAPWGVSPKGPRGGGGHLSPNPGPMIAVLSHNIYIYII